MTTSNSFDFNLLTNQIITISYQNINEVEDGNSPTSEQFEYAENKLNMVIKNWRAEGILIWTLDWVNIPLIASTIVLGTDGFDYEAIRSGTHTTDNAPITGNVFSSFWRKLSTSAAALPVLGVAFTSIGNPIIDSSIADIKNGRLRVIADNNTIPLTEITQEEYFEQSSPAELGQPTQYYFRRLLNAPELLLTPIPDDATKYVLEFFAFKYPQDFDIGSDSPDFLQEWLLPLTDELTVQLSTRSGIFGQQLRDLRIQAAKSKEAARMLDHETSNLQVMPDLIFGRD